jgi:hypothetical protein
VIKKCGAYLPSSYIWDLFSFSWPHLSSSAFLLTLSSPREFFCFFNLSLIFSTGLGRSRIHVVAPTSAVNARAHATIAEGLGSPARPPPHRKQGLASGGALVVCYSAVVLLMGDQRCPPSLLLLPGASPAMAAVACFASVAQELLRHSLHASLVMATPDSTSKWHRRGCSRPAACLLHPPRTSSHSRRSSLGQPTADLFCTAQAELDRPLRGSLVETSWDDVEVTPWLATVPCSDPLPFCCWPRHAPGRGEP